MSSKLFYMKIRHNRARNLNMSALWAMFDYTASAQISIFLSTLINIYIRTNIFMYRKCNSIHTDISLKTHGLEESPSSIAFALVWVLDAGGYWCLDAAWWSVCSTQTWLGQIVSCHICCVFICWDFVQKGVVSGLPVVSAAICPAVFILSSGKEYVLFSRLKKNHCVSSCCFYIGKLQTSMTSQFSVCMICIKCYNHVLYNIVIFIFIHFLKLY